jgi:hypothetical protein
LHAIIFASGDRGLAESVMRAGSGRLHLTETANVKKVFASFFKKKRFVSLFYA